MKTFSTVVIVASVGAAATWCSLSGSTTLPASCPDLHPVAINTAKFIEKSWFPIKQQIVPYQHEDQLNCVVASYNADEEDKPFLQVANSARNGGVDGKVTGGGGLCAEQLEEETGHLRVAPCFFRKFGMFGLVAGPYWVLAIDSVNYEWAIISGGPPDQERAGNTCTTKTSKSFFSINGSGLWLFSRTPTGPKAAANLAIMLAKMDELRIFAGDLKDVKQEGCEPYTGQVVKPPRKAPHTDDQYEALE